MAQGLLEQLGFAAGDRVAVVHVDDIGMCGDANAGAFEALESGPATCGSVMVPCPGFEEAAARARANPDLDLGVHLTLNAEYESYRWGPLLGEEVPSLLAADGGLRRTLVEVSDADAGEVERELRAQIDTALDAGIDVTHLDAHMGTAFLPHIFPIYTRLAVEYRLPVFLPRPDPKLLALAGLEEAARPMLEASERWEAVGGIVFDHADPFSLDFAEGEGLEWNRRRIEGLKPGMNWLLCHAARGGEQLWSIAPETAHHRDFERSFYGGEEGRRALASAGIETVGMRPLRELLRARLESGGAR